MRRQTGARSRRSLLLWACVLWLLILASADLWRGITLWQTRHLLAELDSTLSLFVSAILALGWAFSAAALFTAAVGLWLRREWARHTAQAAIVVHYGLLQVYTWAFVRTGRQKKGQDIFISCPFFWC